jgi:hypothetical protein
MIDNTFDALAASLGTKLPPGVAEFMDYCKASLWPVAERHARRMGLTPGEASEAAARIVKAAIQQLAASQKRAMMRDALKPGRKM